MRTKELVSLLPGVHLRELQRLLGTSYNTTRHHVEMLTRDGELVCQKETHYTRLYPTQVRDKEKTAYSITRNKTTRIILELIAANPRLTAKEIARNAGLAKSTVSEHLHILLQAHLVASTSTEGRMVYEAQDADLVRRLIALNRARLMEVATDRFLDLWSF